MTDYTPQNETQVTDQSMAQMNAPFLAQPQFNNHNQNMTNPQLPQPQFVQNQQQTFQQPNNDSNQQGGMPATTNFILGQFDDFQHYSNILQAKGLDKLRYMSRCYVTKTQATLCGDPMVCCRSFGVKFQVKLDRGDPNVIFKIELNEPKCLQDSIKGNISSLQYIQGMTNPIEDEVYKIDYDRNCCVGKWLCAAFPIFGWMQCLFYAATGCCNTKASLKKSGHDQPDSNVSFTCCYKQSKVTDNSGNIKFEMKGHHSEWCTGNVIKYLQYDNKGQEVQGRKIERKNFVRRVNSSAQDDEFNVAVVFPKNATVDEKMTLIFQACQLIGY